MYLIINHFGFDLPKSGVSDQDIIEVFSNLGNLFIELKKINVDIITHSKLSLFSFKDKSIREYILNIKNINIRKAVIALTGKVTPICSDIDTSFEADDIISFGNCKEGVEELDVCYTFLSCAMFYMNPILTINTLCSKKQYLENNIKIICDKNTYTLQNYHLVPYENVVEKIKSYQEELSIDKYNAIDDWDDYKDFVNENFKYSKITTHCIEILKSKYSYSNSYSVDFRNKIQRIDKFIIDEGGNPKAIDFQKLSKKHYSPESDTRYNSLKKSHSGILNYDNKQVYLNWHTWVQDCRMYFERENDHVCYVHYEKKIL